ncbi:MAG: HupE/UreJ family protein [Euryarchaeota archaeon]|nr:HupE/UreJ family protein [Euryarchaeota archaeon]
MRVPTRPVLLASLYLVFVAATVSAHGVDEGDQGFLESNEGAQVGPFVYLGAKHMVTGYDHLLFLVGVVFFLYRLKDVAIYVSMFTVGHSVTLIGGVLLDIQANAYLIDAVIGLSVVYKGFDNLGGFRRLFGFQPDTRGAVLVFGLFHGFGLATKLQKFALSKDGLVANIVAFNVGVEVGQFLALGLILMFMVWWRTKKSFLRHAVATNTALMAAGFLLTGYQLTGYWTA